MTAAERITDALEAIGQGRARLEDTLEAGTDRMTGDVLRLARIELLIVSRRLENLLKVSGRGRAG